MKPLTCFEIAGPPGSGKTTLALELNNRHCEFHLRHPPDWRQLKYLPFFMKNSLSLAPAFASLTFGRQGRWLKREELFDMVIGGGAASASSLAGTAIGGPMGFLAGAAVGIALDETVGKIVSPFIDYRRAGREMRQFGETTDFNRGSGQRRMRADVADKLGRDFLNEERSAWYYVPIVGSAIDKRLRPEVAIEETAKKMSQMGLMRDIDLNDIDAVKKRVEDTTAFIDKYAGLLHTTREGLLKIKSSLDKLGLNNTQQNAAMINIANTSLSTGLGEDYLNQQYSNFTEMGKQVGFYNFRSPGTQGTVGLNEIAMIRAGQENGTISRSYDAGTLAQQNFVNAAQKAKTPYGLVMQYGNGSVMAAAGGLASKYGSSPLGLMMQGTDYGNDGDPVSIHENMANNLFGQLGGDKGNFSNALAAVLSQETTREGANQAYRDVMGITGRNRYQAKISAWNAYYTDIGVGADKGFGRTYNLATMGSGKVDVLDSKGLRRIRELTDYYSDISGKIIDNNSGKLWKSYQAMKEDGNLANSVNQYYAQVYNGGTVDESIKEKAIQGLMGQYKLSKEEATQSWNSLSNEHDWTLNNGSSLSIINRGLGELENAIVYPMDRFLGTHLVQDYSGRRNIEERLDLEKSHTVLGFLDAEEKRINNINLDFQTYNAVQSIMNRGKEGDKLLKEFARVSNEDEGIAVLKNYGINLKRDSLYTVSQKYQAAMQAIKDWGRRRVAGNGEDVKNMDMGTWARVSNNIAGASKAYASMAQDEEGKKILEKHGITDEVSFIRANQEFAGILGRAQRTLGSDGKLSQSMMNEILKDSDLLLNQNFGRALQQANNVGGTAVSKVLNDMATAESGGVVKDAPGGTPGSDDSVNLDAIKKLADVCEALTTAIKNAH